MSRGRRWTALLAIGATTMTGVVGAGRGDAATPSTAAILHALAGVGDLDIYLNGSLLAADVPQGSAIGPFDLPNQADHDVELFAAMASPPASSGARGDEALESGRVDSQPRAGAFADPSGPAVVRLANSSSGGRWYAFENPMPFTDHDCEAGFAYRSFDGAADTGARMLDGGGGGGVFGIGGTSLRSSAPYTQPVLVLGQGGFGSGEFNLGSFDFGTVEITRGHDHSYVAYGNSGEYGSAEVVLDCASMRIESVRSVPRSPTYQSSRFVPLAPIRLFDTRTAAEPSGRVPAGGTIDVQVAGEVGIPASGVSAVVMNVTAADSAARGHVRVWPTGSTRPNTANLNVTGPGQNIPNLVTVPLGAGGKVSFFALSELDLVADVAGYFVEADEATAGRFVPLPPERVFDTRTSESPAGAIAPGATMSVEVTGRAGIPTSGVDAVVLNLTGIDTGARGFVTAYPGGASRPTAANLNLTGGGDVAPNLAIIQLGDDGVIDFFARSGAHLVADVFGYFTDETAPSSASGLFVPSAPTRILDTRPKPYTVFDLLIQPDTSAYVETAGYGDIPDAGAAAVLANVTGVDAVSRGFLTVYGFGQTRPETANINLLAPGATRPNAVLVPLGDGGDLSIYSKSGAHAIVDIFGYFTS